MSRLIVDGSFEPTWRHNARRDADKIREGLFKCPVDRRAFIAGSGALALEYVAMRRAIASPLFKPGSGGTATGNITNMRLGPNTTYKYVPDAILAMQSGDTILLPAGPTYQYGGATYYYANSNNTDCLGTPGWPQSGSGYGSMFLGSTAPYVEGSGIPADNGTIQGVPSAVNNGRPLLSPTYGILAAPFDPTTDHEMYFVSSTPVTNWVNLKHLFVINSYNFGQFNTTEFDFTGLDIPNNGLTGVTTTNPNGTIPTGTLISSYLFNQQGLFVAIGQNPGWTFTNLEIAYTVSNYHGSTNSAIRQGSGQPGGPYVGSITLNNCYIHDCNMGPGQGYAGVGAANGIFAYFYNSEFYNCGIFSGYNHNIYIGHIAEFLMDNCYSHHTADNWLVKSRAALNLITYSQIRGERTDPNTYNIEGGGIDISNAGLTYFIGNITQQSMNPTSAVIRYSAETDGEGGSFNALRELYVVNCTMVAPNNASAGLGANRSPLTLYYLIAWPPQAGLLSQGGTSSLAARQYWVTYTGLGTSGGETFSAWLAFSVASASVYQTLNISAGKLLTVTSPADPATGTNAWNCYANYGDPLMYLAASPVQDGNNFFWDSGLTQPVFGFTSGGNTISITGTLTNGSNTITGLSAFSGFLSLYQLPRLTVYVGGSDTGLTVTTVNTTAGTITLNFAWPNANYTGTITFGYFLFCNFTYVTALGDSINAALDSQLGVKGAPENSYFTGVNYFDGSYTLQPQSVVFQSYVQVPPGQKLIAYAPPSGPSWASAGVNFWANPVPFGYPGTGTTSADGINILPYTYLMCFTKQNSLPITYGSSYTSPVLQLAPQAQVLLPNRYLQNSSPIAYGTNFTELSSGLVNNNPTKSKLQWYRRSGFNNIGNTQDAWYAVVPTGGLSSYSDTFYLSNTAITDNTANTINGSISIWRGCAANPFDANFNMPLQSPLAATTINTISGNVTVIAGFRTITATGAGTGFTQISNAALMLVEYAQSTSAISGLNVSITGSTYPQYDQAIIDVLVGASAPPTLVNAVTVSNPGSGPISVINFTIPSANAGDILYLMTGTDNLLMVSAIGNLNGPPPYPTTTNPSPIVQVQNVLSANYDPTVTGGWFQTGDNSYPVPASYTGATVTSSLQGNPWSESSSSYVAPLWATIFADANQADYNYALASSSPAKGVATVPSSSPHGQSLVVNAQTGWSGLPTPGTPIPAKAPRSDIIPSPQGAIGALHG